MLAEVHASAQATFATAMLIWFAPVLTSHSALHLLQLVSFADTINIRML
jgi:hypothetical protein